MSIPVSSLSTVPIYGAHIIVISIKQALMCTFPYLETPAEEWIRGQGLNLAAVSDSVGNILNR